MRYVNIKHPEQRVSFNEALVLGLGRDQGLFFPQELKPTAPIEELLAMDFIPRSSVILQSLIGNDIAPAQLRECVARAFDFPLELRPVADRVHALELFHGPSLAFKDFGARFMAQCLAQLDGARQVTILTATSGDTGAAVAQAFYGLPGIDVVVLYPQGKVTELQEKLFCTLGGNIRTVAVEDDFDACQRLVKQSFDDEQLVAELGLNSANSINVARLLAQVCYYFEAASRLGADREAVYCVPSGNFGNVTAGLMACALGLPVKRMIAATNRNDTVPRFLSSGRWDPRPTVATLTNAMDISLPNNFPRVLELERRHGLPLTRLLSSVAVSDAETLEAVRDLDAADYLADPHSALAWKALVSNLAPTETGVFLCTAHPAKFQGTLEAALHRPIPLPAALRAVADRQILSDSMPADYARLRAFLLDV